MTSAFEDAVVCWHMADVYDSSGLASLVPRGRARVGMPLSETAARESKRRGGNGSDTRLTGGWLEVDRTCAGATALTGQSMSLCLRVAAVEGTRGFKPCTLMSRGEGDRLSYRLAIEEGRLFFHLGVSSTARPASRAPEGLFEISVPIGMIETAGWLDIIVRFCGARIELFVDGALVDEEWPLGEIRHSAAPCLIGLPASGKPGDSGGILVDHLALWRRPLSDADILQRGGGTAAVKSRELDILVQERPMQQYWRPRGHNTGAGDCMCTWDGETFHLYWLFDRRKHRSKWGLGAHQYAHAATRDLKNWQHLDIALPITEQWEGSMCTGNILYDEGSYYACYYVRPTRVEGYHPGGFAMAMSDDGATFHKCMDPDPELGAGDPIVFRDPGTGLYHLLMPGPNRDGGQSRTRHVSRDLKSWDEQVDPFIVIHKETTSLECPDLFQMERLVVFHHGT